MNRNSQITTGFLVTLASKLRFPNLLSKNHLTNSKNREVYYIQKNLNQFIPKSVKSTQGIFDGVLPFIL